jgi:hypothetical protein
VVTHFACFKRIINTVAARKSNVKLFKDNVRKGQHSASLGEGYTMHVATGSSKLAKIKTGGKGSQN